MFPLREIPKETAGGQIQDQLRPGGGRRRGGDLDEPISKRIDASWLSSHVLEIVCTGSGGPKLDLSFSICQARWRELGVKLSWCFRSQPWSLVV